MAEDKIEEVKKDALTELQSLQTEKGWTDDQLKEFQDKIEAMTSEKDIEEFLEARRKDEKQGQEEDKGQEKDKDENKELTPEERKAARRTQYFAKLNGVPSSPRKMRMLRRATWSSRALSLIPPATNPAW